MKMNQKTSVSISFNKPTAAMVGWRLLSAYRKYFCLAATKTKLCKHEKINYYGTWLAQHNVMILESNKTLRVNLPTIVPLMKGILDEILGAEFPYLVMFAMLGFPH